MAGRGSAQASAAAAPAVATLSFLTLAAACGRQEGRALPYSPNFRRNR